jgi:hypothetical protein
MEMNVSVTFEARRLYVAPRKSVLFLVRVGDQRVRCYVEQAAARRLIEAKVGGLDGVVVVSSAALALQAEAPLAALDFAR